METLREPMFALLLVTGGAYAWSSSWLDANASRAFVFVTLVAGNLALMALTVYAPWLATLFFFAPLSATDLLAALGLGGASVLWFEAVKRRRSRAPNPH